MAQEGNEIQWSELPPVPSASGQGEGLAGHFAGVHHDVMLVAGGTYFPKKGRPWNGDPRVWNESIFVLERRASGEYKWISEGSRGGKGGVSTCRSRGVPIN